METSVLFLRIMDPAGSVGALSPCEEDSCLRKLHQRCFHSYDDQLCSQAVSICCCLLQLV